MCSPAWPPLALRIHHFSEGTVPGMYPGLGEQESWLAAYYAVLAARPG